MESTSNAPEEPMEVDLTDVLVDWCGRHITVTLLSDGTIGDLKRRVTEIEGMPVKRQRHMIRGLTDLSNHKENDPIKHEYLDHDIISSLPDQPPMTHLIG